MQTLYFAPVKYQPAWRFLIICMGMAFSLSVAAAEKAGVDSSRPVGGFSGSEQAKNITTDDSPTSVSENASDKNSGSKIFPAVWCAKITDSETQAICWKAYRAGLEYYEGGLKQRSRVFEWQHFTTRVIFVVVLILVAIGVYFAWAQFRSGESADKNSELEVSLSGIKVSSSVLGVIILVISLVFFYLYLRYVYPISELF